MRIAVGFPLLLAAALLAAANPSSRSFAPTYFDGPDLWRIAADRVAEAAGHKRQPRHPAQRATVDFAGWQLYLHSAGPESETSGHGLSVAAVPALGAARSIRSQWPVVPSEAIRPALTAYRPQAPPA